MGKMAAIEKVAEWRARLERFELTELTVASFCRREGVSTASLYLWRRRLAETEGKRGLSRTAESRGSALFKRVEVRASPTAGVSQQPVVHLPAGITIELGSDPQVAVAIVKSLAEQLGIQRVRTEADPC